jgi:hypothetical protein
MATKENPGALAGATEAKGRLSNTEYTVPPPRRQPATPTFDAADFPIIGRHFFGIVGVDERQVAA